MENKNIQEINNFYNNSLFREEIKQIQAKAMLLEVSDELPEINWKYIPKRILRNLTYITFVLEKIVKEKYEDLIELIPQIKTFAITWESLSILEESVTRNTALLKSAIHYEMAGYQANSICLMQKIKQIEKESILYLVKLFLERKYVRLLKICNYFLIEPNFDEDGQLNIFDRLILATAAKSFTSIIKYFMIGDNTSFEEGLILFNKLEDVLSSAALISETNLIRDIAILLPIIRKRSTWAILSDYFIIKSNKFKRYLKILARGLGHNVLEARSISELWNSQIKAINNGLLNDDSNKIIKMPTSAGKTRIAEIVIVKTLIENPNDKCIYIAPFNALVAEIRDYFNKILLDLGYKISTIIGSYELDEFEEHILDITDLLILTPEKLDLVLRINPEFFNKVKLIILDEYQIIADPSRGIKFELLITRLKLIFPNIRFICLSAVISDSNLEDFCKWLKCSSSEDLIKSDWRPAIQQYAYLEWTRNNTGILKYIPEKKELYVPKIIEQKIYRYRNPESHRYNTRKYPDSSNKAQIAAELAYKFSESGSVLIYCTQTNFLKSVVNALLDRIKYTKLIGEQLPIYLQDNQETLSYHLSQEWLGENHFITKGLKVGVAAHHGKLPEILRETIESDFRNNKYKIIISTNTLAQGVNLPIKTIIFHTCDRFDREEGRMVKIPINEYWNIAGRAGRAIKETKGLIIHLNLKNSDFGNIMHYYRYMNKFTSIKSAIYYQLLKYLSGEQDEEILMDYLDPELLAWIVEEKMESINNEKITELMNQTLVNHQLKDDKKEILMKFFKSTIENLMKLPRDSRKIYSSTGLTTKSCIIIEKYVLNLKEKINDLFINSGIGDIETLIDLFLQICLKIDEFKSEFEYHGNYQNLIFLWIEGTGIKEILKNEDAKENLGKFIDDFIRYKFSWGISACIRMIIDLFKIDKQKISDYVKYFPSMVKYGLPDPISCWAMSLGIPIRSVAIQIAKEFRIYINENIKEEIEINFENFHEWFSSIHIEGLLYKFKLKSSVIELIAKKIYLNSINPIFEEFEDIELFLPRRNVEIKGIAYKERKNFVTQLKIGQLLNCHRDYDNLIDYNAIKVCLKKLEIGYLPRNIAQILSPEIDTGLSIIAKVTEIDYSSTIPKVFVEIDKINS